VANLILRIYRLNNASVDITVVTDDGLYFAPGNGIIDQICRVDFYSTVGQLVCVFPCDVGSTVNITGFTTLLLNLNFAHMVGAPDTAQLNFQGSLNVVRTVGAPNFALSFSNFGASIDNQLIIGNATNPRYDATLQGFVSSGDQVTTHAGSSFVDSLGTDWAGFAFDQAIRYRVRTVANLPVFTMERLIPVTDPFGLRELPGPFSIPIALRQPGAPQNPLRLIQQPVDSWLTTAPQTYLSQWNLDITGFQPGTIAAFWQHAVLDRYIGALQAVGDLEPLSLLPRFNADPTRILRDADWRLRFVVSDTVENVSLQILGAPGPNQAPPPWAPTQSVTVACDAFQTHSGVGLVLAGNLASGVHDPATSDLAAITLSFTGLTPTTASGAQVRLGAIDLTLPYSTPGAGSLQFTVSFERVGNLWIPRVYSMTGTLTLSSMGPGGQDDPNDPQWAAVQGAGGAKDATMQLFQRKPALLVPVLVDQDITGTLVINESSASNANQQLTLSVNVKSDTATGDTEVLVIDPQPFSVALVQLPNLGSAASAETSEVAQWSNTFPEGPGWRVSAGAGSFQMLLPPQGIGEAVVTGLNVAGEPADGHAVDFRLTPPTYAVLKPSNLLQRYAEPGWNLRRILGYPGEKAPGAVLTSLQLEMLYGLSCTVTTPGLSMSEIFSRVGAFAGPLIGSSNGQLNLLGPDGKTPIDGYTSDQNTQFVSLNKSWANAYAQLLSRLSVLEFWSDINDPDLQLSDGVTYDVRTSAQVVTPGAPQTANSLHGGLQYAFQDPNLYAELISNPHASSAILMNPRLSALGGFGRQRAGFANNKIIVETEVFMGQLETMTVTLIGRIGNLWHHAKHVTVYRRSVRASRQFYLEQQPLEGRPILRKVSEYVEIVQKARSYPETGSALQTGFLEGAEFKSLKINVDSNWGGDVNPLGWQVPLWRRSAQPSDVYPRPHVLLELATDPATGNSSVMGEILDPEKLCFYTDTRSDTGSNTDLWKPVDTIDFYTAPPQRSIPALSSGGVSPVTAAADYTAELGFGRFTYSLGEDAQQVNLVSQRTANAMAAAMKSVTFLRAQASLSPQPATDPQLNLRQIQDIANNVVDEAFAAAKASVAGATTKVSKQTVEAAIRARLGQTDIGTLSQALANAKNVIAGVSTTSICGPLASSASSAFIAAANLLQQQWSDGLAAAQTLLTNTVNKAQAQDETFRQTLLNAVNVVAGAIKSGAGIVLADLSVAQSVADSLSHGFDPIVDDLNALEAQVTDASLQDNAKRALYIATMQRCVGDVNALLDDAQQLIDSANYFFGSQTSTSGDLSNASVQLNAFAGSVGNVLAQMGALETASAADFNKIIETLKGYLPPKADAFTRLAVQLAGAAATTNQLLATINTLRQSLVTAIEGVRVATADAYLQAIAQPFVTAENVQFIQLINGTATNIAAQVKAVCSQLFGSLDAPLQSILVDADSFIRKLDLPDGGDLAAAFDTLRAQYNATLDGVMQGLINATAPNVNEGVNSGMSLLRAFGGVPHAPGLSLNIPGSAIDGIAYFYTDLANDAPSTFAPLQQVLVSSGLQSAVDQGYDALSDAAGQLKQLGIQGMPTTAILDRLVPNISGMQLADLFPHIAGLSLNNLLNGVTVPDVANDNIHISHRVDLQTRQAALDVTMNFPIESSETVLFSIGPATLSVGNCTFAADVHVAGGVGQAATRTSSGAITADWHMSIGGTEIVTFVATALTFDESGHLHFDIQPARVRLAAVLQFLADFVQGIGLGGGFNLNLLASGIQCTLALPFPDMSFGAFGITNLSLGCLFELDFSPEFIIRVGANLGTRTAPFALTIFILGGAGWFETSLSYTPRTGQLSAEVSIAILASAILSLSLGPISGGVYIYFGITAEFHSQGGLTLGILILIQGRVSLLSIIDVDISLLLEAQYTTGGGLQGIGEVDISIKICWCFTLSVHQSVTFTFGSASGGSHQLERESAGPNAMLAVAAGVLTPDPQQAQDYATSATQRINFLT
jgi:hypothetical protein